MPFIASRPVLVPLRNYGTAFEFGTKPDRLFKDSEMPSHSVRASKESRQSFQLEKLRNNLTRRFPSARGWQPRRLNKKEFCWKTNKSGEFIILTITALKTSELGILI